MGSSAVMVSTALIHVTGFNAFEPYILLTLFRNLRQQSFSAPSSSDGSFKNAFNL
ncbi:hypothetical protein V8E51_006221 [Hyaloscypha variabilis]